MEFGKRKDDRFYKKGPKSVSSDSIESGSSYSSSSNNSQAKMIMDSGKSKKEQFNDESFLEDDVELIPKKIIQPSFSNKKMMLLGVRRDDNVPVYLEQASWDCGWYYGFGYLEVLNGSRTDINEHYHFSGLNEGKNQDMHTALVEQFSQLTIPNSKAWELADLMLTFYSLKDTVEVYHSGNSHLTSHRNDHIDLKDKAVEEKLLKEQKRVILKIQDILGLHGAENKILNEGKCNI